jgi:hypothetical protein
MLLFETLKGWPILTPNIISTLHCTATDKPGKKLLMKPDAISAASKSRNDTTFPITAKRDD